MWKCTFCGLDHSGSQPFNYVLLQFCATRKGTQQAASTLVKDARFIMNSEHKERSVCEIDSYKLNHQNLPKVELYQSQLESCFYVELFDFRLQRAARTLRDSKLRG